MLRFAGVAAAVVEKGEYRTCRPPCSAGKRACSLSLREGVKRRRRCHQTKCAAFVDRAGSSVGRSEETRNGVRDAGCAGFFNVVRSRLKFKCSAAAEAHKARVTFAQPMKSSAREQPGLGSIRPQAVLRQTEMPGERSLPVWDLDVFALVSRIKNSYCGISEDNDSISPHCLQPSLDLELLPKIVPMKPCSLPSSTSHLPRISCWPKILHVRSFAEQRQVTQSRRSPLRHHSWRGGTGLEDMPPASRLN